jgi:MoxR-like ATPase
MIESSSSGIEPASNASVAKGTLGEAPSNPAAGLYAKISHEIGKVFVGQDELVLTTLTALFSGGHLLIESVPGLGKTLFVRSKSDR